MGSMRPDCTLVFFPSKFKFDGNFLLLSLFYQSDQYKILHMTHQLSCHSMCKNCCKLMASNWITAREIFIKIELPTKIVSKMAPELSIMNIVCALLALWFSTVVFLLISFRVTSLALGQSCDCPSGNKPKLREYRYINHTYWLKPWHNKHKKHDNSWCIFKQHNLNVLLH